MRAYYITAEEEVIYGNQVRFVSGGALFKDIRDQAIYEYGTIGYQTWLFENMRYLPDVSDPFERSIDSAHYYVYDYKEDSLQEARASDNYKTYGTLYNFPAALSVCPAGWHLPSDEEWKELEKFLGMSLEDSDTSGDRVSGDVGHQLKSDTRWKDGGNGDNSSKFDALPGGRLMYVDWMGFNYLGEAAFFWSSTLDANVRPWYRILSNTSDGVSRVMNYSRDLAYSVRCVKNN